MWHRSSMTCMPPDPRFDDTDAGGTVPLSGRALRGFAARRAA
jgi:hypothetical protein